MLKIKDYGKIIIFAVFAVNISGCATSPIISAAKTQAAPFIYHNLQKGQTLWAISRIYSVSLDELIKINQITDTANLEIGQLILIPRMRKIEVADAEMPTENFIWPIKGKILATFGQIFDNMVNKGLNIQPQDQAQVLASRSGKVVFCSNNLKGFGKIIIIDHGDGFLTIYARNSEITVNAGDSIEKGRPIAKIGAKTKHKKTAYLHFEIRKGHIPQNPYFYLVR